MLEDIEGCGVGNGGIGSLLALRLEAIFVEINLEHLMRQQFFLLLYRVLFFCPIANP